MAKVELSNCAICSSSFRGQGGQKYCGAECKRKAKNAAEVARRKGGFITTRNCPACGIKFVRDGGAKYCTSRCQEVASRAMHRPKKEGHGQPQLRKCEKCKQPFAAVRDFARCFFCRQEDAHLRADENTAAPKSLFGKELACWSCEHWVSTPGAELGYSCNIHFWLRCQPYLPKAKPWRKKPMGV